jgi:hypothetical protein
MTKIFNHSEDTYFKVGKQVPEEDVNISYYEVPKLTPNKNVTVVNEALNIGANINNNFRIGDILNPNIDNILTKKELDSSSRIKVTLDKTTESDKKSHYKFPNPPVTGTIGDNLRFFKIAPSAVTEVTAKVDETNTDLNTGDVIFNWGSTPTDVEYDDTTIEARYVYDREPQLFGTDNVSITNKTLTMNNEDYPLYYCYETRYYHEDVKKQDAGFSLTELDIKEIKNNVSILDDKNKEVDKEKLPYDITITRTEDINKGIEKYKVKVYFAFNPNKNGPYYIDYNPEPDILINNYKEIINADKVFKEVSRPETYLYSELDDDKDVYSLENNMKGYNAIVPKKATEPIDYEERFDAYFDAPKIPFNYEVSVRARESNSKNGVVVLFLIDNSTDMNNTLSGSSSLTKKEASEQFMQDFITEMNNDIANQPNESIDAIYKYATYNSDIETDGSSNIIRDLSESSPTFSVSSSDEGMIYRGVNKGLIDAFTDYPADGYKKVAVILSTGNTNKSPMGESMFRMMKEDMQEDGVIDDVWSVQFNPTSDTNDVDDCLTKVAYNEEQQFFAPIDSNSITDAYQEIVFFATPYPKEEIIKSGSATINKFESPKKLCYVDYRITDKLNDSQAELILNIDDYSNSDKEIDTTIYEEVADGDDIVLGSKSAIINTDDGNRMYITASTDYVISVVSNDFYAKSNSELAQMSVSINENLDKHENWYLDITDGSFKLSDMFSTFHYGLPEFKFKDILEIDGFKVASINQEIADKVDNYTIQTKNDRLYLTTIIEEIDNNNTVNDIETPDNITVYDKEGNEYTVINWDETTGKLKTLEYLGSDDIFVDYQYKINKYNYHGYYDENGQLVHLDLNPRKGHTYMEKNRNTGQLEEKPSANLYNQTIYLYVIPEYTANDENEIEDGSRNQYTLFHALSPITFNEDKPTHPYIKYHIEQGNFSKDDILLLAKTYVNPISNPELITMTDSRTRGGGLKEDLIDELKKNNPSIQSYWDIGSYDGKIYPSNGVNVIKVPEKVLNNLTKEQVREKVNKYFPLGGLPIIRYVKEEDING